MSRVGASNGLPPQRVAVARRPWRSIWVGAVFALLPSLASGADELSARVECQRRATPGRVLCETELEVGTGTLVWADVLVLDAPDFAPPLRSRVGAAGLFMKTERRQRLQLALAAQALGSAPLRVRARGVHCRDAGGRRCRTVIRELETSVDVGPIRQ